MSGSILKNKSSVNNRISCLRPFYTTLVKSFSNSIDILGRNICSSNLAHKLISGLISIWINRFDISNHSGVLSCSSRLFFMEIIKSISLRNCLSVVDSRLTSFALNTILPFYSLNIYL